MNLKRTISALLTVMVSPLMAADGYDLVIAGGTLDAVRLAVRESKEGKKVYLVAPRPYLGEDRAATLILDRLPTDDVNDPLIREIFNPAYRAAGAYNNLKSKGWRAVQKFEPYENVETAPVPAGELDKVTTPLLVKRACDRALIAAGVKYLTGAQVIGVEPMADGARKILISMRDRDQTVTARAFADHRMPASVAKGKGRFSFRYVVGPNVHVEKIDFEYDVPYAGVRGWMAVQNHARTLVPISRDLLDVAEMVTVESGGVDNSLTHNSQLTTLNYDVVVAGGGTGGGPAAMGAARSGVKTLVVEFQHVLGGVSTEGRIGGYGGYYDGNVTGFTTELDRGAKAIGKGGVYFFAESEFLRRGVVEAGGEVWLGAMVTGAEVKDGRLTAVKVTLPDGSRVSVPCKAAVDATGNCDLAAAAGCATEYLDPQELSLQGVGMAGQPLGVNCCNSDIGFVDETDAEDLCAFALRSRLSLPDRIWNQSSLVDSRERRRIRGRFRITPLDLLLKRTYPDTVCIAESAFDTHGQTIHPIFFLRGTGERGQKIRGNVPFRALLPRDVEGILVTGLGVSAHRDSMPVLRMKADIRNMGYAAGLAAAMAAKAGVPPSALDVKQLQRKLIDIGNLPPAVLEAKDSFPISDEALAAAVKRLSNGYDGLAEILSDPVRAMPMLKRETCFEAMHVRAMLGDAIAAPVLVKRLEGAKWDEGWNFKGMSQYNWCVSRLDAIIIALGAARNPCALPALDALARQLTGESEYSHFRALARAYGAIGGKGSADSLARMLKIPGVSGHAVTGAVPPPIPGYSDLAMNAERSDVLRELCVAAALCRLGDPDGSAKRSLDAYLNDPRRVYANFARKVLRIDGNSAAAQLPPLFGDGVHDDTAAIQARLDSGIPCVYLPPPTKHYLISKALEIGSWQELRLDRYSVVRLAPKSDCHMVVNKNWRTGDTHIAVTGGIWDFNNLGQSPNPHMTMHCNPPYKAKVPDHFERDFFHGEIFTFDKVDGLSVKGITLRNPTTYGFQMTRTCNFLIDDVTLDYTTWNPSPLNLDGIHLDGGCHHGRISNIRGTALDDMVALNSADWICSAYEGPIHDIDIDGIYADYSHSAVRLLAAGTSLSRVTIRNVHGNFYVYAIGLTRHFKSKPRGRFEDIVIENVFAAKARTPEGISSREHYPLIWVENGADVGNLSIRNFRRTERTFGVPSIKVDRDATVRRLTVRDCRLENALGKPIEFLDIAGAVGEKIVENNETLTNSN